MSTEEVKPAPAGFRRKCAAFLERLDTAQTSRLPVRLAYLYLSVPMYIFFFGWLKIGYALLMAAVLTAGLFFAWRAAPEIDVSQFCRKNLLRLFGVGLIAVLWMYFSGIGGLTYQNFDHMWRNAVLTELVSNDWPVIVTDSEYFEHPAALIYYFALWLPAALAGKCFGMEAAQSTLFFWCLIGVLLCFTLILGLCRKVSVWIVLGFVFFSGLDTVGDFLLHNSTDYLWFTGNHLEYWMTYDFQMSCMSTQLLWVFNQAIPAWIITLLLLCQKDNRSLIFVYTFSFLSCTLPAIGMLPIVACIGIRRMVQSYDKEKPFRQNLPSLLREVFTLQNCVTGILMTLVSYLFLKSNTQSANGFHKLEMKNQLVCYLVFCFLEFVIYYLLIFRAHRRSALYWVSFATLLVVPLIKVGYFADFVMRGSIPSLVVLYILVMQAFLTYRKENARIAFAALLAVFLIGSLTAYHELNRTLFNTVEHAKDPEGHPLIAEEIQLIEGSTRSNFYGEIQDSFFFRYLAK
ncbi:MAG: hypothetical protein IKN55_09430 [Oscillospiraceae bacterium]|nr:hypothetical protein [Oscillospiraceae bacterium]